MPLVPLITGYPNGLCPPTVAIGPQSLSRIRPLVCPAASKNKKEVQIMCKCPARAMYTLNQLFIWRLDAPAQLSQCAKFGVTSLKNSQTRRIPRLENCTSLARAACASHRRLPPCHLLASDEHQPTKSESYPSTFLACSLENKKRC